MFLTFHTCSTCPFINNKVAVANDDNKKTQDKDIFDTKMIVFVLKAILLSVLL